MAISIYVTNEKVGESYLYSEKKLKGKKKKLPEYKMLVCNESGSIAEFFVTRDAITIEAPANKPGKPYYGHIREDGEKEFRIEIYEPGVGKKGNRYSLKGIGKTIRTNIQIHIGPGRSEGCFLLTDGIKGRNKFERAIKGFIKEDKRNKIKNPESFIIRVQKK